MKNKYYIGVFKEEFCNYCLMCYQEGFFRSVIEMGQMKISEESEFDNTINNMSEYFKADVFIQDLTDRRKHPKKASIHKETERNIDKKCPKHIFYDIGDNKYVAAPEEMISLKDFVNRMNVISSTLLWIKNNR